MTESDHFGRFLFGLMCIAVIGFVSAMGGVISVSAGYGGVAGAVGIHVIWPLAYAFGWAAEVLVTRGVVA